MAGAPGGALSIIVEQEFVSRRDIQGLTGLGKAAVARLVEQPGFPAGTWLNSRVVLYPRRDVLAYLASGAQAHRPERTRVPAATAERPSRFNIITIAA